MDICWSEAVFRRTGFSLRNLGNAALANAVANSSTSLKCASLRMTVLLIGGVRISDVGARLVGKAAIRNAPPAGEACGMWRVALFFYYGFGEVSRAVDVDIVFEGHVVGEELEGDYFGDGEQVFRGGIHFDYIADEVADLGVALVGDGDDASALGLHVGEELEGFLVAHDRVGEGAVDGGDDDEGRGVADEGVGTVFKLAHGIALSVYVGSLFEFEGTFAGDGVVDAAAKEEESFRVAVFVGEGLDLGAPVVELRFDGVGKGGEAGDVGADFCGIHAAEALSFEQSDEEENLELAAKAFCCGNGFFDTGGEGHGYVGLAGHGGVGGVGDGEDFSATGFDFAKGGESVRGFSGLGDDDDGGAAEGDTAAGRVFAGVFDVDGQAAEIFEEDFCVEATVSAGAGGGDKDFALFIGPFGESGGYFGVEIAIL